MSLFSIFATRLIFDFASSKATPFRLDLRNRISSPIRILLIDKASNPHSFSTSSRKSTSSFTVFSNNSVASTSFSLYFIISSISESNRRWSNPASNSWTLSIPNRISTSFKLFCFAAEYNIVIRSKE